MASDGIIIKLMSWLRERSEEREHKRSLKQKYAIIVTDENRENGIFDATWYETIYPDVISKGQTAFFDYMDNGHRQGRDPGPAFDTLFYLTTYPDVSQSGLNPLLHYILHGRAEGRRCKGSRSGGNQLYQSFRHIIVKELSLAPGADAAILATHARTGRLKPHILPYMEQLASAGLAVVLVAIVDRPLDLHDAEIAAAAAVVVRENARCDFSAWATALQLFPALYGTGLLVMTNDSVVPTGDHLIFGAMVKQVRKYPADITALTASHEYGWHVHSYFLALKATALGSWGFQHFMLDQYVVEDKDRVIRDREVSFTLKMQAAGLTVQSLYLNTFSANPTFVSWREMLKSGFPFINILMLVENFADITNQREMLGEIAPQWPNVLEKAGFDVEMVHAVLRTEEIKLVPPDPDFDLLINGWQFNAISDDHSLRIAYFGPWNYESGLGSASREMLNVLRYTDASLNAYPIVKPFHIHRLICPAVETIDFSGRPDIALVHLNPDSWDMLTDEQQAIVHSAKQRIGYWVWETDTIPPTWQQQLRSVDRIWAPSHYCAEIFAESVDVPVDVVPHPVRVPAQIVTDRDTTLSRFGIDPAHRVILYIFDGASYLVRKNPEALVRAFAASGLTTEGWMLVLKVKNLNNCPDAAWQLTTLVEATPGVSILKASLHADEVTSLIAAADIYASPHCSEGFGLTVAEAMAVGKQVVVTDYAGTKDFINATCGYPVVATLRTLGIDHGHYLADHTWAKVDEAAFAAALVTAAKAIIDGDHSIGEAAKANVARLLSYDAVADAIRTSIARTIEQSRLTGPTAAPRARKEAHLPSAPEIIPHFGASRRFSDFPWADGLVALPLESDLSWNGAIVSNGSPDDLIILAPRNARISPDAHHAIMSAVANRPDASLFYADDVAAGEDGLNRLNLKPDFDRTLFVAQDYIGAPVIIRRKMLADVGGLHQTRGTATLYDLILRVAEEGGVIARIPQVLIGYEGKRPRADRALRRDALLARADFNAIALEEGPVPGLLRQQRRFSTSGHPAVTIAIPTQRTLQTQSTGTFIETLLKAIANTAWPMNRLTVIVGDDGCGEPDWARQSWPFRLNHIATRRAAGEKFHYAAKMNRLWRAAQDEHIVFLNDDATPLTPNWLSALMTFAVDETVGGVGARLYFPDGSLQHAGMVPAFRTVVHAWLGCHADTKTYNDWAIAQREWSMVTGAVFATRRSVLDRINGFDERFSLEFNDVDLCLRIRNLGYRIVYNPDAEFIHDEKSSRGETRPPGMDVALFISRWSRWLENDPASHSGLSKNRLDLMAEPASNAWYIRTKQPSLFNNPR